jgi:predicted secreted protein
MTGSPITTVVALANDDTASEVAVKAVAGMNADSDITDLFALTADGPNVVITRKIAAANDATLNLAYADDTSGGLTDDATSNDTTAGVALTTVAKVVSIGGPAMSLDTIDVTCHDSTAAWEEVVGGVLRGGEISLEIVYDPADDTQDATAGNGLLTRYEAKRLTDFSIVFPDSGATTWNFDGYITGFESEAAHDGALTASVTVKTTGDLALV